MPLRPFQQRSEFLPVFVTETTSSVTQTITLNEDNNLSAGFYQLSAMVAQKNISATGNTIKLKPYVNEAQTVVGDPLWLAAGSNSTAVTLLTFAATSATASDTETGYYVIMSAAKPGAGLFGANEMGVFLPYGLQATVSNNTASTATGIPSFRMDIYAKRKA
jgi:hypothetical protein